MPAAASPRYPSDLSDREWAILAPLLPPPKPGGRPRRVDQRVILDGGIFHVLRSGCQWRVLPRDYAPWSVVHDGAAEGSCRAGRLNGTWERLHAVLRARLRLRLRQQLGWAAAHPQRRDSGQPVGQDGRAWWSAWLRGSGGQEAVGAQTASARAH